MRLYRDDLWRRGGGTLLGLGLGGFGAFVLGSGGAAPDAALADRVEGYGLTLVLAGVAAVLTSWLARDLSGIWCRSPRYFGKD
ncbi:MAG: hypothetical protein QF578_12985 [Alphaproteobacteria bacterium]|jgi:hypothetical protein|nr:hypothetical protein [Alphaproteobacteria bacterium]MDP6565733.1 hypothetical protein [Alphaproteobacteria bacterium]MDP6814607.1 hypothetical protein [Alphaproteobacteria bacterium]